MSYHNNKPDNSRLKNTDLVRRIIEHGFYDTTSLDYARSIGEYIAVERVTTSQIRNVYGELVRIKMASEKEFKLNDLLMLKPKMAYAVGRDKSNSKEGMKVLQSNLDDAIDTVAKAAKETQSTYFSHFASFFEAILAYHKAKGGS